MRNKGSWTAELASSLALVAAPALAQAPTERSWWWGHDWMWGHPVFGGVTMLIFWGAVVVLIVYLVRGRAGFGSGRGAAPRQTALEVLQERFARGEIDKQEYEDRRKTLIG